MDSISDATMECYEALFDRETDEWSDSVQELYLGGPISPDLLFIDRVELDERHRGKGIGRDVVKGIIETFGLHCGLVVCKPFALHLRILTDDSGLQLLEGEYATQFACGEEIPLTPHGREIEAQV